MNIVLVEPEIPQNTGNIARTCATTGSHLHLIKPLGFSFDDKHLKRAGMDYWQHVDCVIHETWEDFLGPDGKKYIAVKDYIGLRVKLRFDPPENSALLTALREDAKELEWRLYDEADISG